MKPAVYNSNCEIVVITEQDHGRHRGQSVDLPRNPDKITPRIFLTRKGKGKEEIRLYDGVIHLLCLEKGLGLSDVVFSDLKDDVYRIPLFYPGLFRIKILRPCLK